jgi:hypothetical protein
MPQKFANSLEFSDHLQTRLHLSRELKQDLIASRQAYASRNLELIYQHVGTQAFLCKELARCGEANYLRQGQSANPAAAAVEVRLETPERNLLAELASLEQEIREIHCELLVLINGSLRTFNMIANAWATFFPTYGRPDMPPMAEMQAQP